MTTDISNYWRLADELSVHEAACLIIGVDPEDTHELFQWGEDFNANKEDYIRSPSGYIATKRALLSGLKTESIKGVYFEEGDMNGNSWLNISQCYVSVNSLKYWLSKKGVDSGFFFPDSKGEVDYLDKNHAHYSPKLAAAISAWQVVSNDPKYANNGKTVKQNLINWITAHAAEFNLIKDDGEINNLAIKDQIAMVSNWDTVGGAANTPT
jgi:hypothetical protein